MQTGPKNIDEENMNASAQCPDDLVRELADVPLSVFVCGRDDFKERDDPMTRNMADDDSPRLTACFQSGGREGKRAADARRCFKHCDATARQWGHWLLEAHLQAEDVGNIASGVLFDERVTIFWQQPGV